MKRLLLTLIAAMGLAGPAAAADLPARAYTKAPAAAAVGSWTGFYLFGGAGGGVWDADTNTIDPATGACVLCVNQRQGGHGWFGTVGGGYDWQLNPSWVAGVFGDAQFGELKGTIQDQDTEFVGQEKLRTSWAAGVRVGYLIAPNVLSYVNVGYSGSDWSGTSMIFNRNALSAAPFGTPSFSRNGWFIGGGVENNLNIFGISAPGWFIKTEYRTAFYDRISLPDSVPGGGFVTTPAVGGIFSTQSSITFKPQVQTISTSIVYRFNWAGTAGAKY
jgi:outer membrane immunogenic protein